MECGYGNGTPGSKGFIEQMKGFREYWKRLFNNQSPSIYCLQVEVSTFCQLACIYCPRTVLYDKWPNMLLNYQMYKDNIVPYFDSFEMVFLQGWGEPLLHPNFWDMACLAKEKGKKVGFVTNGIALTPTAIQTACDIGIDVISFTFAGGQATTHEMYRKGASFEGLVNCIRALAEAKRNHNPNLQIGISFTMMRRNLAELPLVIDLAAEIGADYVTASHMDFIPMQSLESEAVFLQPHPGDEEVLIQAAKRAAARGIKFKTEGTYQMGELLVCEPHPFAMNVYISVDGRVVPCHIMGLPQSSIDATYFRGERQEYSPVIIGAVKDQSLQTQVNSKTAQEIREIFSSRANASTMMTTGFRPVPQFCRGCYKLYGV